MNRANRPFFPAVLITFTDPISWEGGTMSEPVRPVEESAEYKAAAEDEAPLAALTIESEQRDPLVAEAVVASGAYVAAVRSTDAFVAGLTSVPADQERAQYALLQQHENAMWQERREALARIGLYPERELGGGAW